MLAAIFLTVVVDLIGFGLILPLLPFYASSYGASPFVVAMLSSVFSIAQFLSAPLLGGLSDRVGRRPVFLACTLLSVAGYLWLALADTLLAIFLARIVSGIGSGKIGIAQAIVADITTPENRARGMGMIGGAFGIGMILGPVLGGLLVGTDAAAPNYQAPGLAAACASAAAFVLALVAVRESRAPSPAGAAPGRLWRNPLAGLPQLGRSVLVLIAVGFAFSFVFAQIETLFPLFTAARLDWHAYEVGLAFTFIGCIVLTMQLGLIGLLSRRLGEGRLLTIGLVNLGAGAVLVEWVHAAPVMMLSILLTASGIALVNPSLSSLVSRRTPSEHQGAALGSIQSLSALGRAIGPLWGGWLFQSAGITVPYFICGGVILLALVLGWRAIHGPEPE